MPFLLPGMVTPSLANIFSWKIDLSRDNFKEKMGDFPGGLEVRTPHIHHRGSGLIPGQGTKIPHAAEQILPPSPCPACRPADLKKKKKKEITLTKLCIQRVLDQ